MMNDGMLMRIYSYLWFPACVILIMSGSSSVLANRSLMVVGYLPHYRIDSVSADRLSGLTDLIYFGLEPSKDGSLPEQPIETKALEKIRSLQKELGCRVLLSVGGWGRSEHFSALASDAASRKRFVEELRAYCQSHHFRGVDFDWEHPRNKEEISSFATLLAETRAVFEPNGLLVTIAQASWQDLGLDVYRMVDRVHLMSYDHDFPQATMKKSIDDVERLLGFGCPPDKIVFGIPFYGRNKARDARTYHELMLNREVNPSTDVIEGYAFNGRETIAEKVRFAIESELAGIMIWEIGQDSPQPQISLFRAIVEQMEQPIKLQEHE